MRSLFGLLVVGCILAFAGSFAWKSAVRQSPQISEQPAAPEAPAPPVAPEVQEAQKAVDFVGPLANLVNHPKVETLTYVPRKTTAADHVGGSVVGSTQPVLHFTFPVINAVQMPFEVPAHAANPQLKGDYQASLKSPGRAAADIELLVLNEEQYSAFLNGQNGEAAFDAGDAQNQQVNTGLPPTMDAPAKYHLVFRNNSKAAKLQVQADFRLEF